MTFDHDHDHDSKRGEECKNEKHKNNLTQSRLVNEQKNEI